ncbi:MAG: hypothetical protein J6Q99_02260, partial [Oscillospiraceae bacterium]|nr:hypothetical protein [Oscillospiraceae bacterium]
MLDFAKGAAQQLDGLGGAFGFGLAIGALQGKEGTPLFDLRQSVFAQLVQLGNGMGGGTFKLLALITRAGFF